jgi:hypothetical protein
MYSLSTWGYGGAYSISMISTPGSGVGVFVAVGDGVSVGVGSFFISGRYIVSAQAEIAEMEKIATTSAIAIFSILDIAIPPVCLDQTIKLFIYHQAM